MKTVILNFFIPVLILGVVSNHFYQVKTNHLTVWKGGGFGMYAGIAWSSREVWFFGLPPDVNPFEGFQKEVSYARQYPSDETLLDLGRKVREKYNARDLRVEVWEPHFDTDGTISRVFLNGVNVP